MRVHIQFSALSAWPGQKTPHAYRCATFQASWSSTIDLLERELDKLGASNVVIEVHCDPGEIRPDGHLRANAKLRTPGVILSFDSPKGPLKFPCDTFTDWKANVRGIALSLAALRAVDRYGVTKRAEQYSGWTALTAPDVANSARKRAAEWLQDQAKIFNYPGLVSAAQILMEVEARRCVYKWLAFRMHPDRGDGDEKFKMLQEMMAAWQ